MALPGHHAPDGKQPAVPKPNRAPSIAATITSRPELESPVRTRSRTRRRNPDYHQRRLRIAQPDFPGKPGALIDAERRCPGPPSNPAMAITSAPALATPAAMIPTPVTGDEFHSDAGARVRRAQILDQSAPGPRRCKYRDAAAEKSATFPAAACRNLGEYQFTFAAGSWPPSPGFDPCAILISSSSARTRYSPATPNLRGGHLLDSLFGFRLEPDRDRIFTAFTGIANGPDDLFRSPSARCASALRAPSDIACVLKRPESNLVFHFLEWGLGSGTTSSKSRTATGLRLSASSGVRRESFCVGACTST